MSKKCTPLWREAHVEVKTYKTPHVWTTFGSWDVEKVHTVVARSTFRSQKCKKNCGSGPLLDVQMSFRVAGVGHLKRICKDALSVAGAVQETCSSELLGGPGDDFLTEVAFCCIFSFGKMILRDRCSTSYDLASLFCGRRSTLYRKTHWYEAVSSALSFPFLKEVSQNCFVFDVVNFENWGSLAAWFLFWCCQVQKLRNSRRIASFLTLSSSKIEEVSQNCSIFDAVKVKNWGSLAE